MLVSLTDTKSFLAEKKLGYVIDFRKEIRIPPAIDLFFDFKRAATVTGVCVFFEIRLDKKEDAGCILCCFPKKKQESLAMEISGYPFRSFPQKISVLTVYPSFGIVSLRRGVL